MHSSKRLEKHLGNIMIRWAINMNRKFATVKAFASTNVLTRYKPGQCASDYFYLMHYLVASV